MCLLNKNQNLELRKFVLTQEEWVYDLLQKYGGKIKMVNKRKKNNEIIGDILIKSSKLLIKSKPTYYLSATDEYPIMFVMAALTNGISKFKVSKN